MWQQTSEYYLEDSCRTGYRLLFSENTEKNPALPFFAYFYRDTSQCDPIADSLLIRQVFAPKLPQFVTTDSLVFLEIQGKDSIYSSSKVVFLTSQRLLLEFRDQEGALQEAEYKALVKQ